MEQVQSSTIIQSRYRGHLTRTKCLDVLTKYLTLRKYLLDDKDQEEPIHVISICQIIEEINETLQQQGLVFPSVSLEILKKKCYNFYHKFCSLWLITKNILSFKMKIEGKKLLEQVSFQRPLEVATIISEWRLKYKNLLNLIDQSSINVLEEINQKYEDSFELLYQQLCSYIDNFVGSNSPLLESDPSPLSNITRFLSLEFLGQKLRKRLYDSHYLNISIQRSHGFISGRGKQMSQSKCLVLMIAGVPVSGEYQSHHLQQLFQQTLCPQIYPNSTRDQYYSDIQIEIFQFAVCLNLSSDFNLRLLARHILKSKIPEPSGGHVNYSLGVLSQFSTQFQKITDIKDPTFDFNDPFLRVQRRFLSAKDELNRLEFLISQVLSEENDEDNGTFDSYSSEEDVDDVSENTRVSPSSRIYSYNNRAESVVRPESSGNMVQAINNVGSLVGFGHVGSGVAQTMESSHFAEPSTASSSDQVDPDLYRQHLERQQQLAEERRKIDEQKIQEAKKIYSSFGDPYLSTVIRKITPFDLLIAIHYSGVSMCLSLWENSFTFIEQLHPEFYQEAINFTSSEFSKIVEHPIFSDFYSKNKETINQFLASKNIILANAMPALETIHIDFDSEHQSTYLKVVISMIRNQKKRFKEKVFLKNFSKLKETEYAQLESSLEDVNEDIAQIVRGAIQNASKTNNVDTSKKHPSKNPGRKEEVSIQNLEKSMEDLVLGKTKI